MTRRFALPVIRHAINALAALLLATAAPAWAVDGVIEINQAAALAGGITPGDSPGFPVTISPGLGKGMESSFRLTSDLHPQGATPAIEIPNVQSHITIDLNGFLIACAFCTHGIKGENASHVTVKNGFIEARGTDSVGIWLGYYARVEGVEVSEAKGIGILLSIHSTVRDSQARENGGHGIVMLNGAKVIDSTAYGNGGRGFSLSIDALIRGSTAIGNGEAGIGTSAGSVISGNVANWNGFEGIKASGRATITGNTACRNGTWGISQTDDSAIVTHNTACDNVGGIAVGEGAQARENVVESNTSNGIQAASGAQVVGNTLRQNGTSLNLNRYAGYGNNVISNSGTADIVSGFDMGGNFCDGIAC